MGLAVSIEGRSVRCVVIDGREEVEEGTRRVVKEGKKGKQIVDSVVSGVRGLGSWFHQ